MDEIVARCPACGFEDSAPFPKCAVCLQPSQWWCRACRRWLIQRACPVCSGWLDSPGDIFLGRFPTGLTIHFKFNARNAGTKPIECPVTSPNPEVTLTTRRIVVQPGRIADIRGQIKLVPGPDGPRVFRIELAAPIPSETRLAVQVVPAAPRIDFYPSPIALRSALPGGTSRASVTVENTGNIALIARLSCSESWLAVDPPFAELDPGESTTVKLRATSKKTDFGTREAHLIAEAFGGPWMTTVQFALPDPKLTAEPVSFGEVKPGHAAFAEVELHNAGKGRVDCTLSSAHPWMQVRPGRVNLPPGRAKILKARALLDATHDGPQVTELIVSATGRAIELLRVVVTALCTLPKPILRAVRKQTVRNAIGPPVERKFQVANDGDGRLECTATADQPWIQIVTPELKIAPGRKRKLRYLIDLPTLPRGEHAATITITSNGGSAEVPIKVHVLDPSPLLEVIPPRDLGLVTPQLPISAFVQVRNAGIGLLTVRAESEDPDVTVTPRSTDVPTGPPVRFNLTIPIAGLPGGRYESAVRFASNGGEGRAVLRYGLPIEQIATPPTIFLGEQPAGRPAGGSLRVQNTGPHPVTLRVRAEDQWLRPASESVSINPGETLAVPFRADLPPGVFGPVGSTIWLEGRSVKRSVTVQAVARRVELIVWPAVVNLGDLKPGSERAFVVNVTNSGEIAVEIRDTHAAGELEVWLWRASVQPGESSVVHGCVRVNSRHPNREVQTLVPLVEDAAVRCVANVVAPRKSRVLAGAIAAGGGMIAGSALAATVDWSVGVPVALVSLVTGAWIYWREMR